jgi:hypothetical protein
MAEPVTRYVTYMYTYIYSLPDSNGFCFSLLNQQAVVPGGRAE